MTPGRVVCPVCPHHCALSEGETGRCRARAARGGETVSLSYGRLTSIALDPVEKKPFARWRPGQFILSVGSFGCNLRCPFCQNDAISQAGAAFPTTEVSPIDLARLAGELIPRGNVGVAFTYNEPLIGYEYVRDTARLLKEAGLSAAVVTNGCIAPHLFRALLPLVDAFNIDLKGWRSSFYDWVGGDLAAVKENIRAAAAAAHVEVTTLIVPGKNDDPADMEAEAAWLAEISPDLPLHISRYFPRFLTTEIPATPVVVIHRLVEVARRHLRYVYEGNV
ncbi:MAG: AmmeMemoRadiSam system radical SAM enzyme [Schwartzia sp. (in: firmicutes)]